MPATPRTPDEETLVAAAQMVGGYRAIALIAAEAARRLQATEPRAARQNCKEMVRSFVRSIEQHGDAETAAYLQDAVGIYQRALREKGGKDRAQLWGPVWMALGEAARRML